MAVSGEQLKKVMRRYPTGVTVVTIEHDDHIHGLTVNAFASVSLDPPLVLISIGRDQHSHGLIQAAGGFTVNILSQEQAALARQFSEPVSEEGGRFQDVPHTRHLAGAPVLEGCLAYLDCRTVAAHEAGDHSIFVGRVESSEVLADGLPLLFFEGRYRGLGSDG